VFTACFALAWAIFAVVKPVRLLVCKSGLRMGLLDYLAQRTQLTQLI
jgi:hypothetical protein